MRVQSLLLLWPPLRSRAIPEEMYNRINNVTFVQIDFYFAIFRLCAIFITDKERVEREKESSRRRRNDDVCVCP